MKILGCKCVCFSKKQIKKHLFFFFYILIEAYNKQILLQFAFSLGDKLYGFPTFDQQKDKNDWFGPTFHFHTKAILLFIIL